jgi:hypothetical protein
MLINEQIRIEINTNIHRLICYLLSYPALNPFLTYEKLGQKPR